MSRDDFLVRIEFDIKALYKIAKEANRKGVRLAIAEGVTAYKRFFENCGAVKSAEDPEVKSFIAYAIDAMTCICGVAIGRDDCATAYVHVLQRIEEIREKYVPHVEYNREF